MFKIFIATSKEFIDIAVEIKKILRSKFLDITIWNEIDFFKSPRTTIETLDMKIGAFDGGIFVFTPDDTRIKGDNKSKHFVPRDNVILEYGIAVGRLGRQKAIPILCEEEKGNAVFLPSDLDGVAQVRIRYRKNFVEMKKKIEIINYNEVKKKLRGFVEDLCQPIQGLYEELGLREIFTNYEFIVANKNDIYRIADVAAYAYGETPINNADLKLKWFNRNKNCFWIVRDCCSKEILASISFLPLTEQAYIKLRNGEITEQELIETDIIADGDSDSVKRIYIEGLCNKYPSFFDSQNSNFNTAIINARNSKALFYAFAEIEKALNLICNKENIESICAIGGSKSGEQLMRNTGFNVVSKKSNRKDKLDFFDAPVNTVLNNIYRIHRKTNQLLPNDSVKKH